MRFLNLSHNNISKFEDGWHYTWLRLRWLGLSHNNFAGQLETDSLNFIKYDNTDFWIDLSHNNFSRVVISDVFETITIELNVVKIDLHHNPIVCDCAAKIFESGLNKHSPTQINAITLTGLEGLCRKSQPQNRTCVKETSDGYFGTSSLIWIIALTCLVIVSVFMAVFCLFKRSKTEVEKEKDKSYDVFISYCHQVTQSQLSPFSNCPSPSPIPKSHP